MRIDSYGPLRFERRPLFSASICRHRADWAASDCGVFLPAGLRLFPRLDVAAECVEIQPEGQSDAIDELAMGFKDIAPGQGTASKPELLRARAGDAPTRIALGGLESSPSVVSASTGRPKEQASSRVRFVGRSRSQCCAGEARTLRRDSRFIITSSGIYAGRGYHGISSFATERSRSPGAQGGHWRKKRDPSGGRLILISIDEGAWHICQAPC